jgi:hypothetical protein
MSSRYDRSCYSEFRDIIAGTNNSYIMCEGADSFA